MSSPPEFELETSVGFILVSGDPWRIERVNEVVDDWFEGELETGSSLTSSRWFQHINEHSLRRRLKRGRSTSFDVDNIGVLKLSVEFTCRPTTLIEGGVLLEGIDLSRALSAEAMLQSYSVMVEEKTRELQAAINSRDAFLASMSHELRTPLNLMIGFSEALLDEVYGELARDQIQVLEKIYTNGQSLLSLLNNLLQLSRLRSGQLELILKPIDLEEVIRRVITQLEETALIKNISIECDIQATHNAHADEQWCEQMLFNLLSNAIKFTPRAKRVGCVVSEGPLGVRVTIWDEGVGIPTEDQQRIFAPFTQVESSLSRPFEGSGLGLSLVAEVTRLHRGSIHLKSELGQGTSFYLDLPTPTQLILT